MNMNLNMVLVTKASLANAALNKLTNQTFRSELSSFTDTYFIGNIPIMQIVRHNVNSSSVFLLGCLLIG